MTPSTPDRKSVNGKLHEVRDAAAKSSKFVNKNRQLSWQWYLRKIREVGLDNVSRSSIITSDIGDFISSPRWGDMYMFVYDPKLKKTLPFYDTFPLVIPFEIRSDRMLGLNLHYLFPSARNTLFTRLMDHLNNRSLTEQSRFMVSWQLLKNYAQFPEVKPCVKSYLYSHVRSRRLLKINPPDWNLASFLPVQNFQKATARTVWLDSNRKIP